MNYGYAEGCNYIVEKVYINDSILIYYLDSFDQNNSQSNIDLFTYKVIPIGEGCQETLSIEYILKVYAPEIGFTTFETFYRGKIKFEINSTVYYFRNSDFSFVAGPVVHNNVQGEKLISFIKQSGKLPNGIYSFHIISDNAAVTVPQAETINIDRPATLELSSPGGILSEFKDSYTYSTLPLFTWYSDYCRRCTFGIRVSEYNQDKHTSLNNALEDWSILPYNQSNKYHEIPWNTLSFQYAEAYMDLEVGKHYVWQIRRSYATTLEPHHDYSPIYIFEVRSNTKKQLDFADPYLAAIQSLIGNKQFNLWFSTGGELERFVTTGESI